MTGYASNLQLFSSLNDPSNRNGLVLSGGSGTYMEVDAPNTGVTFSGGSDFYGSVIASNMTDSGGTHLHYDVALAYAGGQLSGWHEVRN